jgi:adenylate cyclase
MLLPLLPVFMGILLAVTDISPQQTVRAALFDQYQRWYPRPYSKVPVLIVDIDEESLAQFGQWPWPRTRIAELVEKLNSAGASVIGFDVVFAEADRTSPKASADVWQLKGSLRKEVNALPDHDHLLAKSLEGANTVLGFAATRDTKTGDAHRIPSQKGSFYYSGEQQNRWLHQFASAVLPIPELEATAKGIGAILFVPDGDGVVRQVPLALRVGEKLLPTLASETLRIAMGGDDLILVSGEPDAGLLGLRIGEIEVPTTPEGELWLHYAKPTPDRYISARKILAIDFTPDQIQGHIILIGTSAAGLMDLRFSPFGSIPGVEANAQAIEQMLDGHFIERPSWSGGLEILILIVAGFLVGVVALRTRALTAAAVYLALVTTISFGGWYAFRSQHVLLDFAMPAIGLTLTFVLCSLAHHFASEREHRWIKDAFARYVSPNRVNYLVANPDAMELGGRRQKCSFIFTDLAGFTSLMESIDPGEAVALLNDYLDRMIAIAFKHEGTLDRIIGDAVAIVFSAPIEQPDHQARALACALEMYEFADGYAIDLQQKGIAFGRTRIGVHSGEVIVGNFGGATIFDYRALGDPVNTASRLEAVNKHLGTHVCISEAIYLACPDAQVRPVGRLVLKGKSQSIMVYEPMETALSTKYAPLERYRNAYEIMQANLHQALESFSELAKAYPDDPLVSLHLRRLMAGDQGDLIVMSEK